MNLFSCLVVLRLLFTSCRVKPLNGDDIAPLGDGKRDDSFPFAQMKKCRKGDFFFARNARRIQENQ